MRLFDNGDLWTTIAMGDEEDQFQIGDYVKLDFAARVEFDTTLSADVYAVNSKQEETLIATADDMTYHALTWYAGQNSVETTPLAPIPDDTVHLRVHFQDDSTKTPLYEGYAMVAEAKIYAMGVTEVRFGNTELSNSSYIELYPTITRDLTVNVPSYSSFNLPSNGLYSIVRDVENESLQWIEGTPTIKFMDSPIVPSNPISSNQPIIITPSGAGYWFLTDSDILTRNGISHVTIPNNKSHLILIQNDIQNINQLMLLSSQFNVAFNTTQIQQLKTFLNANSRVVLTIEHGLNSTNLPTIFISSSTLSNDGTILGNVPLFATLIFNNVTNE